ncbi:MAG: hypothetical protein MPL62_13175 [Alphaproteobacteria bacterium]|nr:hypothetical protein [Alphaproteobacteria bacterium]MDA8002225.1 hypothetical protein [Alphaproteobacteria bacterium]
METLYIKLSISEDDTHTDDIRNAGLLFQYIAEATGLCRSAVDEIDEDNYLTEISDIKNKFAPLARKANDQS